jgi:hypothetical protein
MMKKILILLLLMISTNVFAEWLRFADNDDGNETVYVDLETIKRKGNKVKMWNLFDFKTAKISPLDNRSYLSQLSLNEYDCEEETNRTLDFYFYSGNMRGGEVVASQSNIKQEPTAILPGSMGEGLFKIACGKK